MDWARAIERNSEALNGIVAALFAMLGLGGEATVGRIPQPLHRAVAMIAQRRAEPLRCGDRLGRRPVGHDALPERDRARSLGDPARDDGNDRDLHGGEATRLAQHAFSIAEWEDMAEG